MTRRFSGLASALALAVLAAACNEEPPSAPTGPPSFGKAPSPFACLFTGNPSLSNAANSYFTTTGDKKSANDLIASMQTGFSASAHAGARNKGFDLLALTGAVSRAGTGSSAAAGGVLTRQALQCMFDIPGADASLFVGWDNPANEQFDFAGALGGLSNGGAFFVRAGTNTDPALGTVDAATGAVVGNLRQDATQPATFLDNISGLAPPSGSTWRSIASNRVLVYGEPVPDGYDWKLIPNTTTFVPNAIVALCPASSTTTGGSSDMIVQQNVGILGYVDGNGVCGTQPPFALKGSLLGNFASVHGMSRVLGNLLTPAPLQASVAVTTVGGTVRGAKGDVFTSKAVPKVELKFTNAFAKNVILSRDRFTITVEVAEPGTNFTVAVGGVQVTLSAANNNGFTQVGQVVNPSATGCTIDGVNVKAAPSLTTESTLLGDGSTHSTVTWTNLCFTKTGAITAIATAKAVGRSGGNGTVTGPKQNVKP
jgi:hypothetical protein